MGPGTDTVPGAVDRRQDDDVDVVAVGAGMAGLYLIHKLRALGFSVRCFESADDVGGTWYWNRYPGARCDVPSIDYSYSFDPELEAEWEWSERHARQPEILRYLQHVADRYDLRRDITFSTRVDRAAWNDTTGSWRVETSNGETLTARFVVMATGCLSMPKAPDVDGLDSFGGDVYFTSRWPHEGVDFTGRRVGVIGTGSSGIQSIPLIAAEAAELTVFQRTPNFSVPAHNGPVRPAVLEQYAADPAAYREAARWSRGGVPRDPVELGALQVSADERRARYDEVWAAGELFQLVGAFNDILFNPAANDTLAEYIRDKIRGIVDDPATAEALCPTDHPVCTKRPCLDTDYYATFNQPHVGLVDLRREPITKVTAAGIDTAQRSIELDAIVMATGFDAMTGAIVAVDIAGRDGVQLRDRWEHGPSTYLGLTTAEFPNLFMITGPGSPSVLSNMAVSIEQHVDWIGDCLTYLRDHGFRTIEPTRAAEDGWNAHVDDCASITLYPQANSWYMGANVAGKPKVFLPYVGGVDRYRKICNEVSARDYVGFALTGPARTQVNDRVIRTMQADVETMFEMMAQMGLPRLETLPVADARAFMDATAAMRPPGPDVGEIRDATLPGAGGDLVYRLYRPATHGPHPVVVYFHGGGWVLGSHESDDPYCRDLCVRSDAVVVSVNYRHAPEARFPAAAEDAYAALEWVANHGDELGADTSRIVVAGWSAGGNLAAVVSQLACDGGPAIAGQVLITPVTDGSREYPSHVDNADGYVLTAPLMDWFWDQYADPADRRQPLASPLLASDLSRLPPTCIVTAEFDPLRDEGEAYAVALADAGVEVEHIRGRGQGHTTITAVDIMLSSIPIREQLAAAVRRFVDRPDR